MLLSTYVENIWNRFFKTTGRCAGRDNTTQEEMRINKNNMKWESSEKMRTDEMLKDRLREYHRQGYRVRTKW